MATEAEIITLLQGRDEQGMALLYDSYAPVIYGVALRITGSENTARQVLSATLIHAWNNPSELRGSERLLSYLLARARASALKMPGTGTAAQARPVSIAGSESKAILDLVYFSGYGIEELANALNIPAHEVRNKIKEALTHLRTNKNR